MTFQWLLTRELKKHRYPTRCVCCHQEGRLSLFKLPRYLKFLPGKWVDIGGIGEIPENVLRETTAFVLFCDKCREVYGIRFDCEEIKQSSVISEIEIGVLELWPSFAMAIF